MGFRFWKSFTILPGVRVNVGKTGTSLSVGPRGAKLTVGSKGTRVTAGIPGTGLSYTEYIPHEATKESKETATTLAQYQEEATNKISVRQPNYKKLVVPPNLPFYCKFWFILSLVILSFFTSLWLLIPAIGLFLRLGQLTDQYNKSLDRN